MIECPICHMRVNLGWAYRQNWPCSGRLAEREGVRDPPRRGGCVNHAHIIQRQASNLRIPEIICLFTIPPRCTQLHRLLEIRPIHTAITANPPNTKEELESQIRRLEQGGYIQKSTVQEILGYNWDELERIIPDILNPVASNYSDLLMEEFQALIESSINGYPPVRGPSISSPVRFEVVPGNIMKIKGPNGHIFRIAPIPRLNTVMVQRSYRRLNPDPQFSAPVDISFRDGLQNRWYPGVEFLGEGIFLMLDENDGWHFLMSGSSHQHWLNCYYDSNELYASNDMLFRDPNNRNELHPVFIWWHTLSHLIMRVLSKDSGYSTASIRERIYLETNGPRARGGIILYTVQPGSDGTLGGLISLVPQFEALLSSTVELAENCSNDPLCFEEGFSCGRYAGACCYSCLLLSETSCEHRNMWLDRHVFLENIP